MQDPALTWMPALDQRDGPLYMAIAEALARDVESGTLRPGTRLPPQRALAEALGIDFTTVSRAYSAAGKRGLTEGRVGQGTFVRTAPTPPPGPAAPPPDRAVDMSMNMPPQIQDPDLSAEMWAMFATLPARIGPDMLMRYQSPGGLAADRAAVAEWLGAALDLPPLHEAMLCNGVQGALAAVLSLATAPGDAIACDPITYPGLLGLAHQMGRRVIPVARDAHGMCPQALAEICRRDAPRGLYLVPSLHNPTGHTLGAARRAALAEVADRYRLSIFEDDAYALLPPPEARLAPISRLAPTRGWYISTLSKSLAPALRLCLVLPPQGHSGEALRRAFRAQGSLPPPLSAAVARGWIEAGLADRILADIQAETARRQRLVGEILPQIGIEQGAYHLWLPLPAGQNASDLALAMQGSCLGLVPGQAFAAAEPPNGVRIGLGPAPNLAELGQALRRLSEVLSDPRAAAWMAV